jgi:hypothetical protein
MKPSVFWALYLLLGLWLDALLTIVWWGMGAALSVAFPVLLLERLGVLSAALVVATDFGNAAVQLLITALVSLIGALLLASASAYWLRFHRWLFALPRR